MNAGPKTGKNSFSTLPSDWAAEVQSRGFDLPALYSKIDAMYRDAAPDSVSPGRRQDVFRAFHKTNLDSVRIVILGEDPYPDPDQANGLAFSVDTSFVGARPSSLGKIFACLRRELSVSPSSDDLTEWTNRGVLLINAALTHQSGSSQPDLDTWGEFTRTILEAVNDKKAPVAWLLLGDFAVDLADSVPVDNSAHRRFENAHPNAGKAERKRLSQKPPFSKASEFLGSDPKNDWIF